MPRRNVLLPGLVLSLALAAMPGDALAAGWKFQPVKRLKALLGKKSSVQYADRAQSARTLQQALELSKLTKIPFRIAEKYTSRQKGSTSHQVIVDEGRAFLVSRIGFGKRRRRAIDQATAEKLVAKAEFGMRPNVAGKELARYTEAKRVVAQAQIMGRAAKNDGLTRLWTLNPWHIYRVMVDAKGQLYSQRVHEKPGGGIERVEGLRRLHTAAAERLVHDYMPLSLSTQSVGGHLIDSAERRLGLSPEYWLAMKVSQSRSR